MTPGFLAFMRYYRRMANQGIAPPDFATEVGQVRLLTSDTDASNISDSSGEYIWSSDAEITALIGLTGSPSRAALRILRLVAMTPSMQYKKWSSADLSIDGPAITRALRDLINDIEKSLDGDAETEVAEFFAIINTGPAMGQPAFYPETPLSYRGVDLDPTLPFV